MQVTQPISILTFRSITDIVHLYQICTKLYVYYHTLHLLSTVFCKISAIGWNILYTHRFTWPENSKAHVIHTYRKLSFVKTASHSKFYIFFIYTKCTQILTFIISIRLLYRTIFSIQTIITVNLSVIERNRKHKCVNPKCEFPSSQQLSNAFSINVRCSQQQQNSKTSFLHNHFEYVMAIYIDCGFVFYIFIARKICVEFFCSFSVLFWLPFLLLFSIDQVMQSNAQAKNQFFFSFLGKYKESHFPLVNK